MKKLLLTVLLSIVCWQAFSQCIVQSSANYFVVVDLDAVGITAPAPPCNGYNYNIQVSYSITFVGNAPADMDFIKAHVMFVDGSTVPFDLPTGQGSGLSVTKDIYRAKNDCDSISIYNIGISHFRIHVKGLGVNDKGVCGFNPLPIELYSFDCEQVEDGVMITWETLSETNNDRFELYGSNDLSNYRHICSITAKNTASIYSCFLANNERHLYYKLVQVDFNGSSAEVATTPCDMWVRAKNNIAVDRGAIVNTGEITNYTVYNTRGVVVLRGYGSYVSTEHLGSGWYIVVCDFKTFMLGVM